MNKYMPEGNLITSEENMDLISSIQGLEKARLSEKILEARATVCDSGHNLIVDLGAVKGIIPRDDAAIGIDDGTVRDIAIITRVNKPVCFKVFDIIKQPDDSYVAILSRKAAQTEALNNILDNANYGDIINAKITHLEPFGCFADIGCGIVSLISIDNISVSRISHPSDRFYVGQNIKAIIKDIDYRIKRVNLTHKELLGTWEENACAFTPGQTVAGIIRSIEDYGIFVELTPNLAGLAEYKENLHIGQSAAVYIKNILPERMKIKLSIIDAFDSEIKTSPFKYFIQSGHIDRWQYSPKNSEKIIETIF
ncbi:MAG: S1 RNA-binding domain-containing protein [Ruminococcaceae bacterium]|nr:S1 RNA-binding domain-containing protein [Oscillospiraceae bacterium]